MTYILFFIFSFVLSTFVNWILVKYSINLGVRNITVKEEVRWKKRKPSVGGISFYIIFLMLYAILSNLAFLNILPNIDFQLHRDLSLLVTVSFGFLIGLVDDARNTNPLLKFLSQILCGLILVAFFQVIPFSPNHIWNSALTVFWAVFLMNSINMLDNMDGLTSSICFCILMGILFLIGCQFQSLTSIFILIISGTLIGFLFYNWHPARIYMGDSGSQFLGIALAHLSITFLWQQRIQEGGYFQLQQIFLPFLFFTIPIFDTATVSIHRLLRRQSPFVGGKDHLSHHFVYLGLKDWQAVLTLGFINCLFILIGLYFYQTKYIVHIFGVWILSFIIIQYFYQKAKKRSPTS